MVMWDKHGHVVISAVCRKRNVIFWKNQGSHCGHLFVCLAFRNAAALLHEHIVNRRKCSFPWNERKSVRNFPFLVIFCYYDKYLGKVKNSSPKPTVGRLVNYTALLRMYSRHWFVFSENS